VANTITVGDVTAFLRDQAKYNVLLDEVQFTDEDIARAMRFGVSEYNAMTPITNFAVDGFPNEYILLMATCAHLSWSLVFQHLRNNAVYNDGDVERIGLDAKYTDYMNIINMLKAEWKQVAQEEKRQRNMESCYGSLSSGYAYIRDPTGDLLP